MSSDLLREAAALMRERAEAAVCSCGGPACTVENGGVRRDEMTARFDGWTRAVDHYVGMSPVVAVAVADWLEIAANRWDQGFVDTQRPSAGVDQPPAIHHGDPVAAAANADWHAGNALTVATAYLGRDS